MSKIDSIKILKKYSLLIVLVLLLIIKLVIVQIQPISANII